jgi:hypothetical protein
MFLQYADLASSFAFGHDNSSPVFSTAEELAPVPIVRITERLSARLPL